MPFGNPHLRIIAIRYSALMEDENAVIFVRTLEFETGSTEFSQERP
jgi:hypothetical protein